MLGRVLISSDYGPCGELHTKRRIMFFKYLYIILGFFCWNIVEFRKQMLFFLLVYFSRFKHFKKYILQLIFGGILFGGVESLHEIHPLAIHKYSGLWSPYHPPSQLENKLKKWLEPIKKVTIVQPISKVMHWF